ncbi:MAG: acetate/propionate family kinase [Eubacteriales bacterium]|nr:acetate/propionate family kinase [Eubacteriales bacterium]
MKILVLNLGSTSFKFKLFLYDKYDHNEPDNPVNSELKGYIVLSSGSFENIGAEAGGRYSVTISTETKHLEQNGRHECRRHDEAFDICIKLLMEHGILESLKELDAVGYKAVHGGEISGARIADEVVLEAMDRYASFAPAHNPLYTEMIRRLGERCPQLRQVACFETSFHSDIPEWRTLYGVPYEWKEAYGIRKYGFHGSSHSYIAMKMREFEPSAKRIISAHLGGSSSMCALSGGKSIASSMGATPQSGLFQNNRSGDFDVFCIPELVAGHGGSLDAVMEQLSQKSGFLGLSGVSNDLRDVLDAAAEGNKRAGLAIKAFTDNIAGYTGMFAAYLGGLDAMVFTGGIGLNSPDIRKLACEGLGFLGIEIDESLNRNPGRGKISSACSKTAVWAIETDEELMVAEQVRGLLSNEE